MLGAKQKLLWRKEPASHGREQVQEGSAGHPWNNSLSVFYRALSGHQRTWSFSAQHWREKFLALGFLWNKNQYGYAASAESNESYERIGASGMQEEIDRIGTIQPGKGKHRGNLINMSSWWGQLGRQIHTAISINLWKDKGQEAQTEIQKISFRHHKTKLFMVYLSTQYGNSCSVWLCNFDSETYSLPKRAQCPAMWSYWLSWAKALD